MHFCSTFPFIYGNLIIVLSFFLVFNFASASIFGLWHCLRPELEILTEVARMNENRNLKLLCQYKPTDRNQRRTEKDGKPVLNPVTGTDRELNPDVNCELSDNTASFSFCGPLLSFLNRKIRPVKHPLATNCSPSPPSLFFLDL